MVRSKAPNRLDSVCLGAHLARMTARTALGKLVIRLPTLRPDGLTERLKLPFLWGRRVLPVAWD